MRWDAGFIIRASSLASGTATLTHVFENVDKVREGATTLAFTTGGTTTSICTTLGSVNTYLARWIECTSAVNASSVLNVGVRRLITGYVVSTQTMTFAAFPQTTQVGDGFKVLSPVPFGCTKIGLANISQYQVANADMIKLAYKFLDGDGTQFGTRFTFSTNTPFHPTHSFHIPPVFNPASVTIAVPC